MLVGWCMSDGVLCLDGHALSDGEDGTDDVKLLIC